MDRGKSEEMGHLIMKGARKMRTERKGIMNALMEDSKKVKNGEGGLL